jgi:hypothetical protein
MSVLSGAPLTICCESLQRVGIKSEHLPMAHNGSPVYVVDSASDAGPGYDAESVCVPRFGA